MTPTPCEAFQAALVAQFGEERATDARYSYAMQRQYSPETHLAAAKFHRDCAARMPLRPQAVLDHIARAVDHEAAARSCGAELLLDLGIARADRDEARKALQEIHFLLDGQEWTPETCDHIARVLRGQQMVCRDVGEERNP